MQNTKSYCVPWTKMSVQKKECFDNDNNTKVHIFKLSLHKKTLEFHFMSK